jgi:hypothetical protein
MFPIFKKILKSDKTNKDLCSVKIQIQVEIECSRGNRKSAALSRIYDEPTDDEPTDDELLIDDMSEPPMLGERVEVESRVISLRARSIRIRDQLEQMREQVGITREQSVETDSDDIQ